MMQSNTPTLGNDTTPGDGETVMRLLSGGQFFFLLIVTACFYYAALFISAVAVGESTASLLAPFVVIRRLAVGMSKSLMRAVRRGGGARGEHDVVEIDEEADDTYGGMPNNTSVER